jgi:cathepsin L
MSRTLSESSVVESHQQWMMKYGRTYTNSFELEKRKKIFQENLEYIENFNNAGNKSYKLGLNPYSDLTSEEFIASHTGLKIPSQLSSSSMESVTVPFDLNDNVPTNFDWRQQGVATNVKNQGNICGNYNDPLD